MEDKEKNIDKIDEFLLGNLSKEERQRVEKEISGNKPLEQTLETQQKIQNAIILNERERMKAELKSLHKSLQFDNSKSNFKIYGWLVIISIIGVSCILWFFANNVKPTNQELFASNYSVQTVPVSFRDEGESNDLTKANTLYQNKEYQAAQHYFEKALTNDNENGQAKIALAISFIEQEKHKEAIVILDELINNKDPFFEDHARWYKGLIFIKQNNIPEAKTALFFLAKDKKSDHHSEAVELLRKLN